MSKKFEQIYNQSITKPEDFWREISEDIFWFKKPTKILDKSNPPFLNGLKMALLTHVITRLMFMLIMVMVIRLL